MQICKRSKKMKFNTELAKNSVSKTKSFKFTQKEHAYVSLLLRNNMLVTIIDTGQQMGHIIRKPTMWFSNRSDTNRDNTSTEAGLTREISVLKR